MRRHRRLKANGCTDGSQPPPTNRPNRGAVMSYIIYPRMSLIDSRKSSSCMLLDGNRMGISTWIAFTQRNL
ncbi:hypothetical protein PUN28_012070 [Cardiocondyla obscurior]|uniref:Uncharacterized protein n=1 Tax=Cardiocondyla obscurior TaxID=286306 RepID=A0AAW2FCK4_9HYME